MERAAVSLGGVKVSILHWGKFFFVVFSKEDFSLRGRGSHVEEQLAKNTGLHGAHSETRAQDEG